jgi:hypothetical protein
MSRGFFGGAGNEKFGKTVSGLLGFATGNRDHNKHLRNKNGTSSAKNINYEDFLKNKMAEYKQKMMLEATQFQGPTLPGTDPNIKVELSPAAKAIIERMAQKKAKAEAKKRAKTKRVQLKPMMFVGPQGGYMDSRGNVYSKENRLILNVDPKTGIVRSRLGHKVGKFDPQSPYSIFKMQEWIVRFSEGKNAFGFKLQSQADERGLTWLNGDRNADGHADVSWFWGKDTEAEADKKRGLW